MNQKNIQLIAKDIRLTDEVYNREMREYALFDGLTGEADWDGMEFPEGCVPERGDFALIYSLLKRELTSEHEVFSLRSLRSLLSKGGVDMPYHKLKAAVRIFGEMGLLKVELLEAEREIYSFGYVRVGGKVDLEQSKLLRTMRANYKRKTSNE